MNTAQILHNQLIRLSIIFSLLLIVALLPREIIFDENKVVCIHKYLLGFQCPLCGMTRAVYQITHLQFVSAISYNVVVMLPLYFAIDIATIFFRQNALLMARKIVVAFIFAGFLLLYAFRIANQFS